MHRSLHNWTRLGLLAAVVVLPSCSDAPAATEEPDAMVLDATGDGEVSVVDAFLEDLGADGTADVSADGAADVNDAACTSLGCPCADDAECASGYCVDTAGDTNVCSQFCDGTCPLEGYECVFLENSGGDAVRLCVPEDDPFCAPCDAATDCGRLDAACAVLDDGSFCLLPCGAEGLCPVGALCDALPGADADDDARYCVPDPPLCEGCADADGDGYGFGPGCLGLDPDDGDATVYPGAPERCDGLDNDDDGAFDEDFPTLGDACGTCESGVFACAPDGTLTCAGDGGEAARNGCGGCELLDGGPGDACGICETGVVICGAPNLLVCTDEDAGAANACGGCGPLAETPGAPCGACGLGTWVCEPDSAALRCEGDPGPDAVNACGGCGALAATPGDACGACGVGAWACDGVDAITCDGDPGDAAPASCLTGRPLRAGGIGGPAGSSTRQLRGNSAATTTRPMDAPGRRLSPFPTP